MSGWSPGDGRHDEVSFGPERAPWWPSRPRLVMLSVGLASGLLIGGLLGVAVVGEAAWWPGTDETLAPTVVAGAIEKWDSGDANGPVFALLLRNGGDETVEVSGLRFDDLDSELVTVKHALLLPGAWRYVTFGAPADCSFDVPRILGSVRLTVLTPDGEREQEIPLAGGGRILLEYHAVMCAPQKMPRPQDLEGVWVVEDAFGGQYFVGIMLWRFGRDGSFVADPEGLALLDVEHGVDGRYTLDDGEMRLHVEGGYGCNLGGTSIWRPSLVEGPRTTSPAERPLMTVAWVGGECPDDMDGQIWILRRVLDSAQ